MAKKPASKKAKSAKPRKPAKGKAKTKVQEASHSKSVADRTTIKLASAKAIEETGRDLTRLEKDAAGVTGDISSLKSKAARANVHWPALKDAHRIAKKSDAKLAVYMAHFVHCLDALGITERSKIQIDMFNEAVARDAKKAAETAVKAKPAAEPAKVDPAAEQEARLSKLGRGAAVVGDDGEVPATKNGGGTKVNGGGVEEIKRKLASGEFISPAERQQIADFDEQHPSGTAH